MSNLGRLHSCAPSLFQADAPQRYNLAVALHSRYQGLAEVHIAVDIRNIRSFEIYGKWSVQASKQANIHMHVRNEVTAVWGSLRLALITILG